MPLQSLRLSISLRAKLKRKTRQLIAKGFLLPVKSGDSSYDVGFCAHIQNLPARRGRPLIFGRPEGIRVFIQSGTFVIGVADFLFAGKNLKLSHVVTGHSLKPILATLNSLEKKYVKDKISRHVEFVQFLLSGDPYMLVKSPGRKEYYHSNSKRLKAISPEKILRQVNQILAERDK